MSIFISYRRGSSSAIAGRIDDRLRERFGMKGVFRDVDNISPGEDFREAISDAISRCDVFLAVLGSDYLSDKILLETDFVRIEVEAALAQGKHIIPVFVPGYKAPMPSSLPSTVSAIVFRQGIQLDVDRRFESDIRCVFSSIESARKRARARTKGVAPRKANAGRGAREIAVAELDRPVQAKGKAEGPSVGVVGPEFNWEWSSNHPLPAGWKFARGLRDTRCVRWSEDSRLLTWIVEPAEAFHVPYDMSRLEGKLIVLRVDGADLTKKRSGIVWSSDCGSGNLLASYGADLKDGYEEWNICRSSYTVARGYTYLGNSLRLVAWYQDGCGGTFFDDNDGAFHQVIGRNRLDR